MKNALRSEPWRDHRNLDPAGDEACVWWLGQAGFLIELAGKRLVIDPYLSDSLARKYAGKRFAHRRMMDPPVAPEALSDIDYLLCTHGHTDHMDAETIGPLLAANPDCKAIVPEAERTRAIERGIAADRMIGLDAGDFVDLGGLRIAATPSAHEDLKRDPDGRHHFLGYVIRGAGVTLWHSGDTIPFAGLREILLPYRVDLALLPVNGRDVFRAENGVPGNLTTDEAVDLATAIGARAMIAHHFGLFDFNTVDAAEERQRLSGQDLPLHPVFAETHTRYAIAADTGRANPLKVLMVCRGNICRSPLGEGLVRDRIGADRLFVDSAAIEDWNVGNPPDRRAVSVAARHGIDISQLRARQVTASDFDVHDVVFAMDGDNMKALERLRPTKARARLGLLGHLENLGQERDIGDPYYGDETVFDNVFKTLEIIVGELKKGIKFDCF